jgi:hypothetical protein
MQASSFSGKSPLPPLHQHTLEPSQKRVWFAQSGTCSTATRANGAMKSCRLVIDAIPAAQARTTLLSHNSRALVDEMGHPGTQAASLGHVNGIGITGVCLVAQNCGEVPERYRREEALLDTQPGSITMQDPESKG